MLYSVRMGIGFTVTVASKETPRVRRLAESLALREPSSDSSSDVDREDCENDLRERRRLGMLVDDDEDEDKSIDSSGWP